MKTKTSTPAAIPADTAATPQRETVKLNPTPRAGLGLMAFYDDCAYWANFARQKEQEETK